MHFWGKNTVLYQIRLVQYDQIKYLFIFIYIYLKILALFLIISNLESVYYI